MQEHRLAKLKNLKDMGVSPYINNYNTNTDLVKLVDQYSSKTKEELEEIKPVFEIAGRIISMRDMGKAAFMLLRDRTSELQVYIKLQDLTEQERKVYENVEVGDFVAIKGYLFRTKTNELTLYGKTDFKLLTKALEDMPEKWHGLRDVEKRYRQRYADLLANYDVRELFKKRFKVLSEIRKFLTEKDFYEVETPMMHSLISGAAAEPFSTHHNALNMPLYLRIAPELFLKRLVVGGFERVFELNRNFRNEGVSTRHNPEFTMLEFYMAYKNYIDAMDTVEELIVSVVRAVNGNTNIKYGEHEFDISKKWARLTMIESIEKYSDYKYSDFDTYEKASVIAKKHHIDIQKSWGHGRLISELFEAIAEHHLVEPTFITSYPKEISPLAKSTEGNPDFTDRYELYIGGIEISNGFSELNDPIDQKERFEAQVEAKLQGDAEATDMDEDYIRALTYGLPPTAGVGIGIDRLIMITTGQTSIREVLLFPHMKPIDNEEHSDEEHSNNSNH